MKTVLISAALVLATAGATAGTAQAHMPLAGAPKTSTQRLSTLGSITVKQLPPAKVLQDWVLHNPYKPQTIKLSFID